jgi:hypothetical protein
MALRGLKRNAWFGYPFDAEAVGGAVFVFGDGEEEEGEGEGGEEGAEGEVGAQGAEPHEEGEDGPAEEEDGHGGGQVLLVAQEALRHAEPRHQDGGVREPEGAVGRERRGAERVARRELPHARQHLRQPPVEERQPRHHVRRRRRRHPEDPRVAARQHERRQRKTHQPQRRRVRHPALRHMLAQLHPLPILRHRCPTTKPAGDAKTRDHASASCTDTDTQPSKAIYSQAICAMDD